MNKEVVRKVVLTVAHVVWAVSIFLLVSLLLGLVIGLFATDAIVRWLKSPVGLLVLYAAVDVLAVAAMLLPFYIKKLSWHTMRERLGLAKPFKAKMIPWALYIWILYYVVFALVIVAISFIPALGVNLNEKQSIGFSTDMLVGVSGYIAAFLALVVVVPVLEETMFRGYLFGRLRETTGFWVSTVLTSLAFAFLHGQVNVGIDVFILSMFLCYLRERFDSIWPGVIVHALKNGLAYTVLFILPLLGVKLV